MNVKSMLLVTVILVVLITLSIPILYIILYKTMRANQRVTPACRRRQRNQIVLKNLLLLNTCYMVCNLPVICLVIYAVFSKKEIYYEARITHAIMSLSSVLNPIIYVLRDSAYRRTLLALLHYFNNRVLAQ